MSPLPDARLIRAEVENSAQTPPLWYVLFGSAGQVKSPPDPFESSPLPGHTLHRFQRRTMLRWPPVDFLAMTSELRVPFAR